MRARSLLGATMLINIPPLHHGDCQEEDEKAGDGSSKVCKTHLTLATTSDQSNQTSQWLSAKHMRKVFIALTNL